MTDLENGSAGCGCSKDATVEVPPRGLGCCAEREEALVEDGDPNCCGSECCEPTQDLLVSVPPPTRA